MDQEAMRAGGDVWHAAAVDLEVERRGRDDPQRLVQGREGGAPLIRYRRGMRLSDGLLEARAFAIGPDGAAEDLRRIVRRRLRPTRERVPCSGDQSGTQGDATFQEPAATRDLGRGFGRRRWIAPRCLLGRLGRVSSQGRSPPS